MSDTIEASYVALGGGYPIAEKGLTASSPDGWDMFDVGWTDFAESLGLGGSGFPSLGRLDAVGLSLAIQCADVKARDIAKSDMVLWRRERPGRRKRGGWVEVLPGEHWFARLLSRKPNDLHSWTEFWRMLILHLDLTQNAYIFKRVTRAGEVQELIPILPGRCLMRVEPSSRKVYYEINASTDFERTQLGADAHIIVPAEYIIHLRGRLYDGAYGLSSLALGNPIFTLLKAINDYQTNLFGNDGKQPLVFETAQSFTGEQADRAFRRLKDQLTERVRKFTRNGDPILLEAGLTAKAIAIGSRDALTTDSFNQQVARVCGVMQTPPHKIYHYESVKYDNQAAADDQYANDCLIPLAKNVEEKFRLGLLLEDEWDSLLPEFDREAMLAGDRKTMMDRIERAMKVGLMEINEGRERLSLNPREGGDVLLVPVNMAMVDRKGNVVVHTAAGQNANLPGTGDPVADDNPPENQER